MSHKKLFLGVRNQSAGYVDGGVFIGLYEAENEEAAKEIMLDLICGPADNPHTFYAGSRHQVASQITMRGVNEHPVQVSVERSTYDD